MAYAPLTKIPQQFFDNLGNPLVSGTLYAYLAGTSTPTNMFSDNAGTVAGTSVVLDSRGEPTTFKLIWLNTAVIYKFVLKDSTGTTIWTIDNIPAGVNAADVNYTPAGSGAVTTTVQTKLRETVSVKDFGAAGDGVTNDTAAIQNAITAKQSGGVFVPSNTSYDNGKLSAGFVNVNSQDGATIGTSEKLTNGTFTGSATGWTLANFTYSANAISHTAGSVGTASQSIVVKPFRIYLASITLTTTTYGTVDIVINGTSYLESGYQYAVGTTTNQFNLLVPDSGTVTFTVSTNSAWAGSIDTISLIEVSDEWRPNTVWLATDDAQVRIPSGIKFGRYNAGNISIGDKQTMSLIQNAGVWNVAVGARALATNQTGIENTAIGTFALQYATSSKNAALGYSALKYLSGGEQNTAIGFKSYVLTAGGSRNTGVGYHSGFQNVSGVDNVAIGWQALYSAKIVNGNTVVGSQAGMAHTGASNTLIGALAGYLNADVNLTYAYDYTTSVGSESKCYGSNTTALGFQARCGSDPNSGGTAIATSALAIGYQAIANADESVVIGPSSTVSATASIRSTVIGKQATCSGQNAVNVGFLTQTTDYSVAVGSQSGVNLTGTQNTSIGYGANNYGGATAYSNVTSIGVSATATGSNQVTLGNSSVTTLRCQVTTITALSDARDKKDIAPLSHGLDFVMQLNPVTWTWDARDGGRVGDKDMGFIAQDLKEAQADDEYLQLVLDNNPDRLEATPGRLLPVLVKALQELKAEFDAYKASHP